MTDRTAGPLARTTSGLAVLGTLPYLALKVAWLSGSRVGLLDPDFGRSATMHVANSLTLLLDATAIALALLLVSRWGRRCPAWLVLLPMWVGTGLLAPILVVVPLQLLIGVPSSGSGSGPIADWVYLVVYAGFMWQGVFLLAGFAAYVVRRWGVSLARPLPRIPVGRPTGLTLALLALAGLALLADTRSHPTVAVPNLAGDLASVLVAAVGLVLLHGHGSRRRTALGLAWLGSGATLTWGLYQLVLLVVPNDLVGGADVSTLELTTQALRVVAGGAAAVVGTRLLLLQSDRRDDVGEDQHDAAEQDERRHHVGQR